MLDYFRIIRFYALSWLVTILFASTALVLTLITGGFFDEGIGRRMVRWWGRFMLWLLGIKLSIENAEHLRVRQARIMSFNHSSTLDAFIVCACFPVGGVAMIKREFLYFPIINLAAYFLSFLFIDRKNPERAKKSMKAASQKILKETLTLAIAPEGTRSKTGELGPFKKGLFRMAVETKSPILPMVIHGASKQMPFGQHYAKPGNIVVELLDPIPTTDFELNNLDSKVKNLHDIYITALKRKV